MTQYGLLECSLEPTMTEDVARVLEEPHRSNFLNDVAAALTQRFEESGDVQDLDLAINAYEQTIEATPSESPLRARRLLRLGHSLVDRFNLYLSTQDCDHAIAVIEQAMSLSAVDEIPNSVNNLNLLGDVIHERFKMTNMIADLDRAIKFKLLAVALTHHDCSVQAK